MAAVDVLRSFDQLTAAAEEVDPFRRLPPEDGTLSCSRPPEEVLVRFSVRDDPYRPFAGRRYVLELPGGELRENKTDGEGMVEEKVPASAQTAWITVWYEDPPVEPLTWELLLGQLEPLTVPAGVQARLSHLFFDVGEVDGVLGPKTEEAIWNFQAWAGIEPTGQLDKETLQKLEQAAHVAETGVVEQSPFLPGEE